MVEFANPAALWFLTLIIPIILLYLLKRKRVDKMVPSTILWKQALEDTQANTPFQKLRSSLLLLLQILIVVLLTALLAKPYFPAESSSSRLWILVIDRSASMQATDEKPSRFEVAKKKLLDTLDSILPTDEVLLISVGVEASILQNFTRNHDAVQNKLQKLEPEDVNGAWDQLHLILKPLLRKTPKPKVVIASDFTNFPPSLQALNFDSIPVGQASENVGIIRASLETLPDSTQEQLLFVQIKNFSRSVRQADLQIHQNEDLLDAFDIRLKPMETAEKTMKVSITDPSRLNIALKPEDSFALDNDFVLLAEPVGKTPVRMEVNNLFLKRAIEVLPAFQISPDASILISNRLQDAPGLYILRGDHENDVTIVQWNSAAPQLRFVDAGLWKIAKYSNLEPPPGAQPLLETSGGVVGYAHDSAGKRRVVLGFQIEDSNLPLLAGFPIFVGNALDWIREGLYPERTTLTDREHPKEGEIDSGKGFVNFADPSESQLQPQKIQGSSVSETKASILKKDFSKWFLMVLLAVVILEWWVFHRKESV